jgi:hypothetical protein
MQATEYGSEDFLRACRVAEVCGQIPGRGPAASLRRLRAGSPQLTWYSLNLPRTEVRLTDSPAGRMIRQHFEIRHQGRRRYRSAQGVLELPAGFDEYMRGRRRQAVRTNVGHARRAGLTVLSFALDGWTPGVGDERRPFISPGPVERWLVADAAGAVLADSILSVDAEVALLHGLMAWGGEHARWLLHTAIVERLCGSCGLLLTNTENAYRMGPGNAYFQRLLGYRISRLRLRPSRAEPAAAPPHPAGLAWPGGVASWRGPQA